jgi:hypothetical protein
MLEYLVVLEAVVVRETQLGQLGERELQVKEIMVELVAPTMLLFLPTKVVAVAVLVQLG